MTSARLALLCLLLAAPAAAQETRTLQSSQRTRPGAGGAIASEETINRTFHRILGTDEDPAQLLLEIEASHRVLPEDEGFDGEVLMRAFSWSASGFVSRLWEHRAAGQRAQVERYQYVKVTRLGCCANDDTHTLFRARDGRQLITFVGDPLYLLDGEGGEAVVGVQTTASYDIPESLNTDALFRGILVGAFADDGRDAVVIRIDDNQAELRGEVARCDSSGRVLLGDWAPPPGEGLNVCLQTSIGGWIVIPIVDSRFDADHAKLPAGVTLAALPA